MNFKNWFEENELEFKIYVDLDQTLIDVIAVNRFPNGIIIRNYGGVQFHDVVAYLHPGALKFLEDLHKVAPVFILTYGPTVAQNEVAKAVGIPFQVIGVDQYHSIKPSPLNLLIDDKPLNDQRTQEKLHAIGILDPNRFVQVLPWHAGETDNGQFGIALEKVEKMVPNPHKPKGYLPLPEV